MHFSSVLLCPSRTFYPLCLPSFLSHWGSFTLLYVLPFITPSPHHIMCHKTIWGFILSWLFFFFFLVLVWFGFLSTEFLNLSFPSVKHVTGANCSNSQNCVIYKMGIIVTLGGTVVSLTPFPFVLQTLKFFVLMNDVDWVGLGYWSWGRGLLETLEVTLGRFLGKGTSRNKAQRQPQVWCFQKPKEEHVWYFLIDFVLRTQWRGKWG